MLDSRPTPSIANDLNVTLGSMSLAAFSSFQIAGSCHNACCDGFLIGQPLRDFERPKSRWIGLDGLSRPPELIVSSTNRT
jgi:hypothetical protein